MALWVQRHFHFFIFTYLNRVEIHSVYDWFTMCPVNENKMENKAIPKLAVKGGFRDAGKKVGQGGPTGAKGHLLP